MFVHFQLYWMLVHIFVNQSEMNFLQPVIQFLISLCPTVTFSRERLRAADYSPEVKIFFQKKQLPFQKMSKSFIFKNIFIFKSIFSNNSFFQTGFSTKTVLLWSLSSDTCQEGSTTFRRGTFRRRRLGAETFRRQRLKIFFSKKIFSEKSFFFKKKIFFHKIKFFSKKAFFPTKKRFSQIFFSFKWQSFFK